VAYVLYAGRDWMLHYRFLVPALPLLLMMVTLLPLLAFSQRGAWGRYIVVTLVAITVIFEVVASRTIYLAASVQEGQYTDGLIEAGRWLRQNTQPGDVVAVVDAGALAYYSRRRIIDIVGLNNTHIAHSPRRSDPAYVLGQNPAVVQLHVEPVGDGTARVPIDAPAAADLFYHPHFQERYRLWDSPQPYWPDFFVRRSTVADDSVSEGGNAP
jgi:hypothetical protein